MVAVSRVRSAVSLVGRADLLPAEAERWLVGLRWIAILGMLGTTLVGGWLVPRLSILPILAILGGLAAINVGWSLVVFGVRSPFSGSGRYVGGQLRELVAAQIAGDVITLASILWFSGGVSNPFAGYLLFQIALAGLMGSRRTIIVITLLTLASALVLFWAPQIPFADTRWPESMLRRLADLVALAGLATFIGISVLVYGRRLSQLQDERSRNERLVLVGRMAGGMAHELNTPLATILLASQELVYAGQQTADQDIVRLSETLAKEAKRASEIIDLLRGQVRADAQLEPVELTSFIRDTARAEFERLGYVGARTFRLPKKMVTWTPRVALQHVLCNVIKNAVQATTSREKARIEVTLAAEYDGGLSISVIDNGVGIRQSLLPRIGEPFQTTKEAEGGMGLGLYVCAVLAERMGAELRIESVEGLETRVSLVLPPSQDAGSALAVGSV